MPLCNRRQVEERRRLRDTVALASCHAARGSYRSGAPCSASHQPLLPGDLGQRSRARQSFGVWRLGRCRQPKPAVRLATPLRSSGRVWSTILTKQLGVDSELESGGRCSERQCQARRGSPISRPRSGLQQEVKTIRQQSSHGAGRRGTRAGNVRQGREASWFDRSAHRGRYQR